MISQPLTLSRFFADTYALYKPLRPASVQSTGYSLLAFDRWHQSPVALAELSDDMACRFVVDQLARLSPHAVRRQRNDVLAVWRYAAERNLCDPPQRVRPVKIPRRIPDAWTLDEVRRMIDAASKAEGVYPSGVRIADYWELLIRVAYDTALRWSDLMSLPVDVLATPTFNVIQSKTQTSVRKRLRDSTKDVARRTLGKPRELLLPWSYHRELFWPHWKKHVLIPAGLPTGRREGPQKMRRTSASHWKALHQMPSGPHLGQLTEGLADECYNDPSIVSPEVLLPPELD